MRWVQKIVIVVVVCTAWSVHTVNRPAGAHHTTTTGNEHQSHLTDTLMNELFYQFLQAHQFSFTTRQVLYIQHCELWEILWTIRTSQPVLNAQRYCFIFQHIVQIHLILNIYPIYHEVARWKKMQAAARSFVISNTFSTMSKFLTSNIYCWSRKTLVTRLCTDLRVNGICAVSFCPQKTNNRTPFFTGCFYQQRRCI